MEWLWMISLVLICLVAVSYTLLIGIFTYGWMRNNTNANSNANINNRVSVVIAVRNEEDKILDLLEDMRRQDYPKELTEIIVVDDHSIDTTRELVKNFILKDKTDHFRLIKLDDNHNSGKKAALTCGIHAASGDIILTSDADCRVGASWISSMMNSFRKDTQMVFGPVAYFFRSGFFNAFQSVEFLGLVASGAGAALAGHPFICNGANLAYRKEAFQKTGGFSGNEKYISGDDVFLLHKIKSSYGRKAIVFNKDEKAIVRTYPAKGLKRFLSQRVRWASKSKAYSDALSIITAIIVFTYSLSILFSIFAGFFKLEYFVVLAGLLFIKMLTDLPLIAGITGFVKQRKLMRWYLPFQLIYPFYIILAGSLSFFRKKTW